MLNSDYFGESKEGGLRMWNNIVYNRGGLALHAGCKVIPVGETNKTVLIVGLSGTGKTTTTFTTQRGSKPAQDDFIALMPGGRVHTTENGCFAKTFGLDPTYEPVIYNATTKPDACLENVSVDQDGKVDFFDTSCTKNGRTTWPFSYVDPWPADRIPPASFLLILNRDENILPGVARLDLTQAAAYFMLGETTGTSAGGKDEEGKFRHRGGHRGGHHRVDPGPRLRLRGGGGDTGRRRHRDPAAPPALRKAGPDGRVRGHGGPAQAGAEGVPRILPRPGRLPGQSPSAERRRAKWNFTSKPLALT